MVNLNNIAIDILVHVSQFSGTHSRFWVIDNAHVQLHKMIPNYLLQWFSQIILIIICILNQISTL